MATHYCSVLAWKLAWAKEPGGLQFMRSQRVEQSLATNIFWTGHYNTSQTLAMSSKLLFKLIPNSQIDSSKQVCRVKRYQKKF